MSTETSTDYRRPYRPRLVRAANGVLGLFGGRGPLTADALVRAAETRTKLADHGDRSFEEPLAILLHSIEHEAGLHALGRLITRIRIVSTLATRLRLAALLRARPELERARITRPIVIVGLPRTGTTLLHRLLASDEQRIRALASWEALMPIPDGDDPDGSAARRIAAAERSEAALRYMAPDFFAVHPIDARGPEEEILLLDLELRSTVAEATMRVPTFAQWLEGADQSPAYRTMARVLAVLQAQRAPTAPDWRWVLKTPHHLEWLDELPKVLDRPLVVWTHRDPTEVVASFCSMIAHGRGVFSDRVDPHEIGRSWLRKGKRMVERAMAARAEIGEDSFVDVRYADLVRDPVAVARMVQERAGLASSPASEAAMREGLRREVKDRHGVHRYHLADFGLAASDVAQAFAPYRDAFDWR
ncbi:MAG TPA: sulfotransferase [Nannocystaceae bacterium]|nr:sulfotransferase [Nannocystaceae bacterium]